MSAKRHTTIGRSRVDQRGRGRVVRDLHPPSPSLVRGRSGCSVISPVDSTPLLSLSLKGGTTPHNSAPRRVVCSPPSRSVGASAASSATASAASPSPRPVKPSLSVVVARTFTWETSHPRARREPAAHLLAVWRDPRLLPDEHDVRVDQHEPSIAHLTIRLRQEHERVGAQRSARRRTETARRCRQDPRPRATHR